MNLQGYKEIWSDVPEFHKHIHELFSQLVDLNPELKAHRDFVEQNIFGFGERSFWWLWKLILEDIQEEFPKLLEIGVFKCATLSLWRLLKPDAIIRGISPMNGIGTGWTNDDYYEHMKTIHNRFNQRLPVILEGMSDADYILDRASRDEYSVIYVDGGHSFETALADLTNYAPMVKPGGYLVIDDCNNNFKFPPTGFFCGIQPVTDAKLAWLGTNPPFKFVFSVEHISVFQRV